MTIGIIEAVAIIAFCFAMGFAWKVGYSFGVTVGDMILEKYIDWKKLGRNTNVKRTFIYQRHTLHHIHSAIHRHTVRLRFNDLRRGHRATLCRKPAQ